MGDPLASENEAPFCEKLTVPLVITYTPEGGTVVDCFGGSGTVAAVAKKHGRSCISIELRESQCNVAKRRIEQIKPLGEIWITNFETCI